MNLVIEYLDTKRNFDEEYSSFLEKLYQVKAKKNLFDVVITVDNAAFNFMQKNGDKFYSGIPVVFCGVNDLEKEELSNYPNFYGYNEKADHEGTINAALKIFPDRTNVLVVNDNTLTGKAIMEELKRILPKFENQLNFEILSDFTIESLREKVSSLDESFIIYLLVLNRDYEGNFISYTKGISEIHSVARVPVFGSWDFYENKGLFGGKITRGYEQGENAALMAEDIMDDGIAGGMSQFNEIENSYVFDYNEMQKFNISRAELPVNSKILNLPQKDELVFKIIVVILFLLLIISFILTFGLFIRRKRNLELLQMVDTQTKELKEANTKLRDIINKNNTFFSILAHDLRNFIGSMVNASIMLRNKNLNLNTQREDLLKQEMFYCADKTSNLLEDLLYWGKNQFEKSPEVFISEIDLVESLKSIADTYKFNQGNIGFEFYMPRELLLISDVNIIMFIFRNIIQNAVKYSYQNGIVKISCEKDTAAVVVKITDNGIGMSSEIVESIIAKKPIIQKGIFDKKNSGIGLPTAMEYLELINGKILIKSEPEEGASFIITIPDGHSE
ncbi:MAG: sensor histidine kinase [Spirochaetales bacterium]|nr:sensor histidine kinase [Spirochaetales bacterium]